MAKLSVSIATYNEIAALLEKEGRQINNGEPLTIEKGTALMPPIDFRMATIRKDACAIGAQSWDKKGNFIDHSEKIFNYIIKGKEEEKKETKTKSATTNPTTGW